MKRHLKKGTFACGRNHESVDVFFDKEKPLEAQGNLRRR
jgi:hypothetical protein